MAQRVKGIDFVLKIGTKVLAGRKGASMSVSSDTVDTTAADSLGWKEKEYGFKEWSISTDGILTLSDTGYEAIEEALLNGTKLDIEVTRAGKKYTGSCLVTSFEADAPFDDVVSYSINLEGSGPLAKTAAI